MAYLVGKIAILAILALVATAQVGTTIPQPDPSWMITKSKLVAHKDSLKLLTTAFNALLQTSSMPLTKDADPVQLITYSTT
jgi:hypothetical protein